MRGRTWVAFAPVVLWKQNERQDAVTPRQRGGIEPQRTQRAQRGENRIQIWFSSGFLLCVLCALCGFSSSLPLSLASWRLGVLAFIIRRRPALKTTAPTD